MRTPVFVNLPRKPSASAAYTCSGNVVTLTASGGTNYLWYKVPSGGAVLSNSDTYTTPALSTSTIYYVSSVHNGCESPRTAVNVVVTPTPLPPVASNVTVCMGSPANLHAAASSGIFNWYSSPIASVPLISSPDYTTPPLSANTTFYVSNSLRGCEGPRTPVTVTVSQPPAAPTTQNVTTCYQSSTTLTASGSNVNNYQWYDAPVGGKLLATGLTFITPVLTNSTTYYLQANNGSCASPTTPIIVIVKQQAPPPVASSVIVCWGTAAMLTATSQGGTYQWYNAPQGGTLLATGPSYTTPPLKSNTTYYVQNTQSGCISQRAPVTVTLLAALLPPIASNTSICPGDVASLSASGSTGGYGWYDSAAGGNLLSTAQVFVTPPLTRATTYYVEAKSNTCSSVRTPVIVKISPVPSIPTVKGTTVCPGTAATLTANTSTGTVQWYDAATGGNLLATGNAYNAPPLTTNTTYYVGSISGQCTSARTPVTVTVNTLYDPEFQYSSGSYCKASINNPIPVIYNLNGGVFSSSPAGLVFVSKTTGQINLSASKVGNYVVSFANNGPCPGTTSVNIEIGLGAGTTFTYGGPYCQNGANPSPVFSLGSVAGAFSSSPAGLVFVNITTGQIDLSKTKAGTYTISNNYSAPGSCPAIASTWTVTIDPMVIVSAGPAQAVPSGIPVQLAGSITGGANTGTWSGGKGTFSNSSLLNAVYTPAAGETKATLTLTSADPPGPCGSNSATVIITFSAARPPAVQNVTDCAGSSTTLSATAPGGTYQWYDAPTGGNLLSTGPNFTTLALTANTTYYVQTTINGLTSNRTAATVTVNTIPAAPVVANATTCTGSAVTLTASGSTGTYQWYDAAAGGSLLSTSNTYTTPVLTAYTSYYVETHVKGCISARKQVDVTVTKGANITSASGAAICSGQPLNYKITADQANVTFNWGRAQIAGISNPAVTNKVSSSITETLINNGGAPVNAVYVITPIAGGCPGPAFNYVVTVNPVPVVTSAARIAICDVTPVGYALNFNVSAATFSWARAAVPGISNVAVTGQSAGFIREVLFNTTTNPIDVTYVFNYKTGTCDGTPFNLVTRVFPQAKITSASTGFACSGEPQDYAITSNLPAVMFNWSRAAVANISNPAVTNQTSATINEALINTSAGPIYVSYNIIPMANGCPGNAFRYIVMVNPQLPKTVANSNSPVCIGTTLHLSTAPIPNATYLWTGQNGFTSILQNPDVNDVTYANAGDYTMVFTVKGCASQPITLKIAVDELPVANAGPDQQVCPSIAAVLLNGSVTGGTTTGVWSTAGTGTFSPSNNTLNARYIPLAADKAAGSVILTLKSTSKDNCNISSSAMTVTFSKDVITSGATGMACSGMPQNYVISSNIQAARFSWGRAAVPDISNPAVSNQTSGTITESLVNTSTNQVPVVYLITPVINGCPGTPFKYTVTVNNSFPAPVANSNSPVCVGTAINLSTATIVNATYSWRGPNGFTSALQNPVINNITAAGGGTYALVYTNNGCDSPPGTVTVAVDALPVANAGPNQQACVSEQAIQLAGVVTGGTNTGVWSTSGTGTFSPSATVSNAQYIPSVVDKTAGTVTLTLTSTSKDNCAISTSLMTITFSTRPAVIAGSNQELCSQTTNVALNGKIFIPGGATWSTSGSGTFSQSEGQLNANYMPSAVDVKNGTVILKLSANNAGVCFIPSDSLRVTFIPPPIVYAGGTRYLLKGGTITLNPTVSENNVHYRWLPNIDIDNDTLKNPVITGDITRTYTLTVTDARGCVNQDTALMIVPGKLKIINTFTPNGDGINDYWDIPGLISYLNATVDIFDRYGRKVFHSLGYPKPWDGTSNGGPVSVGVYYYIIDTHFNGEVFSGYVTVIR